METKNIQQFMNSYSVKMIIVSGLAILLMIPAFLIEDIIRERIVLSEKVKSEKAMEYLQTLKKQGKKVRGMFGKVTGK